MKNEYYVADKVIADTINGVLFWDEDKTKYIRLRNNWTCSEYLDGNSTCRVMLPSDETLIATGNNENYTIQYDIHHSPDKAPECGCRNWYVTIKGENEVTYFDKLLGCGSSDKIIDLPPNSEGNTFYTIKAQLHSNRK